VATTVEQPAAPPPSEARRTRSRLPLDPWILGLSAIGFALRTVYAVLAHGPENIGDQIQYAKIAHDFSSWWSSADAIRTPGYPLLLAINFSLGQGTNVIRVEQALIVSVAALLVALLAARFCGLTAGRATAALLALLPPLVMLPALLLPDALAASLFAAACFCLLWGRGARRQLWWFAGAGAFAAAAALVRPNLLLGLGVIVVAAPLLVHRPRVRALAAAAVVLPVVALYAPWIARNFSELHKPAPVGINPGAEWVAAAGVHLPIDRTDGPKGAYLRSLHFYTPGNMADGPLNITAAQSGRVKAFDTLRDNVEHRPLKQLSASAFWQRELWLEAFDDHAQYGRPTKIPYWLSLGVQAFMLVLALGGLWLLRGTALARLVLAASLVLAAPFLIHLPEPRYGAPMLLLLAAPAGAALAAIFGRLELAPPTEQR